MNSQDQPTGTLATVPQFEHTMAHFKGLNHGHFKALHDGSLADLITAVKLGLPINRETLRRGLGLYDAKKHGNSFPLTLDRDKRQWEKWKGEATPEYCKSFEGETDPAFIESCLASLYYFPMEISKKEAAASISKVHAGNWEFGQEAHLRTLAAQMPKGERYKGLYVTCLSCPEHEALKWKSTLILWDDLVFRSGWRTHGDTTLPAGNCVLVVS